MQEYLLQFIIDTINELNKAITRINNLMIKDIFSGTNMTIVEELVQVSGVICGAFAVMFLIMGIIEDLEQLDWKSLNIWYWMKYLARAILYSTLAANSCKICIWIYEALGIITKKYSLALSTSDIMEKFPIDQLKESVLDMSKLEALVGIVTCFFPLIVVWIVEVAVDLMVTIREFYILILAILSPLAVANFVRRGYAGVRLFVNEYVATVGQSIVIVVGLKLFSGWILGVFSEDFSSLAVNTWQLAKGSLALAVIVFGAKGLFKTVVDFSS